MNHKSTPNSDDLVNQYNLATKEHKNVLKLLIKCAMCAEESDREINENTNRNFEKTNFEKEFISEPVQVTLQGTESNPDRFEENIHKFNQENNRLRGLFIQFWYTDIATYQKLLQYEMTMLENTKIQFTHNFFNRHNLSSNKNVMTNYRRILELFFISETSLLCGGESPLQNCDPIELRSETPNEISSPLAKGFDDDQNFVRLKTQIQTNIKEIRQMSQKLEAVGKMNKKSDNSLQRQQNMVIEQDSDSIDSMEKSFHNEPENLDMPVCVENFLEKIKNYQSIPVCAKITGYRSVSLDNSTFNQFCVKIKVKHAFYEIWRRYNSFRKLHTDLCVVSSSVCNCYFPNKLLQVPNDSLIKYRKVALEEYLNTILGLALEGKIGKFTYYKNNSNIGPNLNQLHAFFDPQAQDHNLV